MITFPTKPGSLLLFLLGPKSEVWFSLSAKLTFGGKRIGAACHPQRFEKQCCLPYLARLGGGVEINVTVSKPEGYVHQLTVVTSEWQVNYFSWALFIAKFSMLSFLHQTTNEHLKDSWKQTSSPLAKLVSSSGAEHKPMSCTVALPDIRNSDEERVKEWKARDRPRLCRYILPWAHGFGRNYLGKCKHISKSFFSFPASSLSPESPLKEATSSLVLFNIDLFTVQNIYTIAAMVWPLCLAWRICSSTWSLENMLMLSLVFTRCLLGLLPRHHKARCSAGPPSTWATGA